jgi:hypothetical protein
MPNISLRAFIEGCGCAPCRALTSLVNDAGAPLRISTKNTGRMCEFAVVAAAGLDGLTAREVVQGRRAYAEHLGVQMEGPTQNDSRPNHIGEALKPRLPGTDDKPHIDLGRATPSARDGRFFLLLDGIPIGPTIAPRPRPIEGTAADDAILVKGIEIAWEAGIEQVPLDLDRLDIDLDTEVSKTAQYIDLPASGSRPIYRYETTSSIVQQEDGSFDVRIHYAHENNLHIEVGDSWWGFTSIVVRKGDDVGSAKWNDNADPARGRVFTFRKAQWHVRLEDLLERDRDEVEIEQRTDLTVTEKYQLIKARRGQGQFRKGVLEREPSCRLTGVDDPRHLKASHIQPWAASTNLDRLDANNGLMLSPHIDHLFDKADISFNDDGTLLASSDIRRLLRQWGVEPDNLTTLARPFMPEQIRFLEKHRERFFERHSLANSANV